MTVRNAHEHSFLPLGPTLSRTTWPEGLSLLHAAVLPELLLGNAEVLFNFIEQLSHGLTLFRAVVCKYLHQPKIANYFAADRADFWPYDVSLLLGHCQVLRGGVLQTSSAVGEQLVIGEVYIAVFE